MKYLWKALIAGICCFSLTACMMTVEVPSTSESSQDGASKAESVSSAGGTETSSEEISKGESSVSSEETASKVQSEASSVASSAPEKDPNQRKIVVLTFDDSSASHRTVVAPILKEFGFGATFFITEMETFETNKNAYMTWEQIKELNDMGFEIGNHGYKHHVVGGLNREQLKTEVETIEARCKEYGIPKPVSYAYPGGQASAKVYTYFQENGYLFARGYEIMSDELKYLPYDPETMGRYEVPHCCLPIGTGKFISYLNKIEDDSFGVLLFHGVPDTAHTNVTCDEQTFRQYMKYLKDNNFTVIAMRDLADYLPEETMKEVYEDPIEFVAGSVPEKGNLALTATVSASAAMDSEKDSKTLSHVNNGTCHNDGWVTLADQGKEQWLQLTLKETAPVDTVAIWPRSTGDSNRNKCFPKRFCLKVQLADGSWKTVVDYSQKDYLNFPASQPANPRVFSFDKVSVKAVKLECTDYFQAPADPGNPGYWLEEVGIYCLGK